MGQGPGLLERLGGFMERYPTLSRTAAGSVGAGLAGVGLRKTALDIEKARGDAEIRAIHARYPGLSPQGQAYRAIPDKARPATPRRGISDQAPQPRTASLPELGLTDAPQIPLNAARLHTGKRERAAMAGNLPQTITPITRGVGLDNYLLPYQVGGYYG